MNAVLKPQGFVDMTAGAQRFAICAHVRNNEFDLGLFGESITEHRLFPEYVKTFLLGDTAELGRLVDRMTREYFASIIEDEWEMQR